MASTYLQRTQSSTGNRQIFTLSAWVKRSKISSGQHTLLAGYVNGTNNDMLYIPAADTLGFWGTISGSQSVYYLTNRVFRDTNAWYHIVLAVDTTLATASDRVKIYVNGVQETSFSQSTAPAQDVEFRLAKASNPQEIGSQNNGNTWDGLMSHIHFIDGTQYQASDFGETDSTTGEWKIKTSPSVTYGNNGFFILKDGNSVTDQSGNSNNFTASGTLTPTIDNPSNNYCTWNILHAQTGGIGTIGNGNKYLATQTDNTWRTAYGSIAFPGTGKFYCEFKCGNMGNDQFIGIIDVEQQTPANSNFATQSRAYAYRKTGVKENSDSGSSYGDSWTSLDFLQLAYNNGAIWFGKNGTWQNSATLSEISAGTTTNAAFTSIDTSKHYTIAWDGYNDDMIELNAGDGYFRVTDLGGSATTYNPSTGDTAARFKYEVPTGYQPISTKGLNT